MKRMCLASSCMIRSKTAVIPAGKSPESTPIRKRPKAKKESMHSP